MNKALCELKHRLLYIEVITSKALINIFTKNLLPIHDRIITIFTAALSFYKKYDSLQDTKTTTVIDFKSLDAEFEKHLAELYRHRSVMWQQLDRFLINYPQLSSTLAKFDYELDVILGFINLDQPLPTGRREQYEKGLSDFANTCKINIASCFKSWQTFFLKDFARLQRLVVLLNTYRTWQTFLEKQLKQISTKATLNIKETLSI